MNFHPKVKNIKIHQFMILWLFLRLGDNFYERWEKSQKLSIFSQRFNLSEKSMKHFLQTNYHSVRWENSLFIYSSTQKEISVCAKWWETSFKLSSFEVKKLRESERQLFAIYVCSFHTPFFCVLFPSTLTHLIHDLICSCSRHKANFNLNFEKIFALHELSLYLNSQFLLQLNLINVCNSFTC